MGYLKGDLAHFHNEFRDPHSGELVDPDGVVFKHETPGGTETTLVYGADDALTREGTGRYVATVSLTAAGTWGFRWETTGAYQGADEFRLEVADSQFS